MNKKRGLNSRQIKRKTGVDLQTLTGMLDQVESLVHSESKKGNVQKEIKIKKEDVLFTIQETISALKKELNIPLIEQDKNKNKPIVRIR